MLGDRDYKSTIENSIDAVGNHLDYQIDKNDLKKVHASEATGCLRRAYYNRINPLPTPRSRFADLLGGMFRNLEYGAKSAQFSLDDLTLEGQADMIADDLIMLFKSVKKFPDDPFAKDILYVNACMWIYDKVDAIIIYIDGNGKEISFSVTRNKKMFEEVIRRVRVLVDLLKEKKIPILEPSIECSTCQYYERCFTQRKESKTINLMNLLGKSKNRSDMIDEI
jgi:CRISPR-associated exonuclease Cas4|tara:strand:+ start:940 stop:1608 length:669 start_codon:yes stop_codon:yes gene_type:complete